MKIDLGSLAFNCLYYTKDKKTGKVQKSGNPSWQTTIAGHGKPDFKVGDNFKDVKGLVRSFTFKSIPLSGLSVAKGKGGTTQQLNIDPDCICAAAFDNVVIEAYDGVSIKSATIGKNLVLLLIREPKGNVNAGDIHIKYSPTIKDSVGMYSNDAFYNDVQNSLGLNPSSSWLVTDIIPTANNGLKLKVVILSVKGILLPFADSAARENAVYSTIVSTLLGGLSLQSREAEFIKYLSQMVSNPNRYVASQIINFITPEIKKLPNGYSSLYEILSLDDVDILYNAIVAIPLNNNRSLSGNFGGVPSALVKSYRKFLVYIANNGLSSYPNAITTLPLQCIWYGAPGSGKSYTVDDKSKDYSTIRTTFHPDTDYSSFVGSLKPTTIIDPLNGKEDITYKYVKQAFAKAYLQAWQNFVNYQEIKPQILIIEELNRGNCAQIFGDLFQLLDRTENNFSAYPIVADSDLQTEIEKSFGPAGEYELYGALSIDGEIPNYKSSFNATLSEDVQKGRVLLLPPNLHIWATMNTSDQSLFPMDSAFKRRWDWEYVKIDYKDAHQFKLVIGTQTYFWDDVIKYINKLVFKNTQSTDKQIGNRFCKDVSGEIDKKQFINKVMFYLWDEICKDGPNDPDVSFFRWKPDPNKDTLQFFTFEDLFEETNVDAILNGFIDYIKSI